LWVNAEWLTFDHAQTFDTGPFDHVALRDCVRLGQLRVMASCAAKKPMDGLFVKALSASKRF
jgi:hypothetical protein